LLLVALLCQFLDEELLSDRARLAEPEELLQHERLLLLAAHVPAVERCTARILKISIILYY
jgi:hypothetical protein